MTDFKKMPDPNRGLSHILPAFMNSMAGLRTLLGESAARLELILIGLGMILFALVGAPLIAYLGLLLISFLLLAIEALNTAIECVVDRVSPEISEFGRITKDLGSAAVFCGLVIYFGYVLAVLAHQTGLVELI